MKRIVVVGPPCSGKTMLATTLAKRLDIPHIELDALWWEPRWTEAGADTFRSKLRPLVSQERWVVDGNYWHVGAIDTIYPAADTIVWLEFPLRVTVPRAVWRTVRRAVGRTELWSGNREPLSRAVRLLRLTRAAINGFPSYNESLAEIHASSAAAHLTRIRLRSPSQLRRWVASVDGG